jgi:hypothetical protein
MRLAKSARSACSASKSWPATIPIFSNFLSAGASAADRRIGLHQLRQSRVKYSATASMLVHLIAHGRLHVDVPGRPLPAGGVYGLP